MLESPTELRKRPSSRVLIHLVWMRLFLKAYQMTLMWNHGCELWGSKNVCLLLQPCLEWEMKEPVSISHTDYILVLEPHLPLKSWELLNRTVFCIPSCQIASDSKESACNAGDLGLISGSGIFPWRRKLPLTLVFLPGEFHGQTAWWATYSSWGHKELDTTEPLSFLPEGLQYHSSWLSYQMDIILPPSVTGVLQDQQESFRQCRYPRIVLLFIIRYEQSLREDTEKTFFFTHKPYRSHCGFWLHK